MSTRKKNLLSGGPKTAPKTTAISKKRVSAQHEVILDSIAEVDESVIENPTKSQRNKRTQKQAGLDGGETLTTIPKKKKSSEQEIIPDSMAQEERHKNGMNSVASKPNGDEVIPDSFAEVDDEIIVEYQSQRKKRTPKQAGIDEGLGETLKAVKKIKLSTPTPSASTSTTKNDVKNTSSFQTTIRAAPPGKQFQKARQGSFYVTQPSQRISVNEMSVWTGN